MSLSSKRFIPCCEDWLVQESITYQDNELDHDKWNGQTAKLMRERMFKGDFSACKRELCQEPLIDVATDLEVEEIKAEGYLMGAPIIEDIKQMKPQLSRGPSFVAFGTSDNACNLQCPSCRSELITKLSTSREQAFYDSFKLLKLYRQDIEVIRLGDNGEVFFSPRMKRLLKSLTTENFPKLKEIKILSNGTLLNEKMWQRCLPGIRNVAEINISIDAGNEEHYQKVRGNLWPTLLRNLDFISTLKRSREIERFYLNMTIQYQNYEGLSELIDLAHRLEADSLLIHPIHPWGVLSNKEYLAKAVHRSDHPDHQKFREVVAAGIKKAKDLGLDLNCKLPEYL